MIKDQDVIAFISRIRTGLADAAARTDQKMRERGLDDVDDYPFLWVEALADVTNECVQARKMGEVKDHLVFFSGEFESGSKIVKECIDQSFVENLFGGLKDDDKKWGMNLLPENLKKLYEAMWGNSGGRSI